MKDGLKLLGVYKELRLGECSSVRVSYTVSNQCSDRFRVVEYMTEFDLHSCAQTLRSCNIEHGRQLHLLLLKRGLLESTLYIGNCFLQMYNKCGYFNDARHLFDEMPQKNSFSWNSLIEACVKSGKKEESVSLFNSMPHDQRNEYSWNSIISNFAKSKTGDIHVARSLFNEMPRKSGVVWNCMIHGYAQNGNHEEALRLFKSLNLDPCEWLNSNDTFILATTVGICANLMALNCGKQIHTRVIVCKLDIDSVLLSSLVNMYAKCGDLDSASFLLHSLAMPDNFSISALISGYAKCGRLVDARKVFDSSDRCVVLWNSMVNGYIANNEVGEALNLFNRMQSDGIQPDLSTLASVLSGCASLGVLKNGEQVHAYGYKHGSVNDMIVASALIDMYSKCGCPGDACRFFNELKEHDTILLNSMISLYCSYRKIEDARHVFQMMPNRSLISWNSMIVGYSQNGCAVEAINLFCEMHRLDLRMDEVSLASAISACATICALKFGEQIFSRATIVGLEMDKITCTAIVDLYCKCGNIRDGRRMFDKMVKSDEAPWNSMLMGYSMHGYGYEALNLFDGMLHAGVTPNDITLTGVLSACNHNGLVEEGWKWFYAMKSDYNIEPGIEHYSCMIDLCARGGFLEEAMDLIERMPFKADASMWSSILRGCVIHGDKALGEKVSECIIALDPENPSAYVQLASIHADSGDWERSAEVRKTMQGNRIQKNPGCSWIDLEQDSFIRV